MKVNIWVLIFVLLIAVGGYIWAFIAMRANTTLHKKLLGDDMDNITVIDEELTRIRKSKDVTMDDLIKSKERLDKLINEVEKRNTDTMSIEDALKIIEGL